MRDKYRTNVDIINKKDAIKCTNIIIQYKK